VSSAGLSAAGNGCITRRALDLTLYDVANVAVVHWRSIADARRLVGLVRFARQETLERATRSF
jgi:hypothetical protein